MALDWTGENLTSSQLIVYANAQGSVALHSEVTTLASQLRAQGVLPLYTAVPAHPSYDRR